MRFIRSIALSVVVMFSAVSYAQTTYKTVEHAPAYPADQEMGKIKTDIAGILQKDTKIVDKVSKKYGNPKDVMVLDDRIEFSIKNQKMIINFSDLLEYDMETGETMMSENNGPFNLIYYEMELWNCTIYFRMKSGPAYQLANDLFFIQQAGLNTLLDLSKLAASNMVFGKWVAKKIPLIACVELSIKQAYNGLDYLLSFNRIIKSQNINGTVLNAAKSIQKKIDDNYLALRNCQ